MINLAFHMNKTIKICLLFCLVSIQLSAQSYFYFQYKIGYPQKDSVTYISFITLNEDGTAFGRLRYIEPTNQSDQLFDIHLVDSVLDILDINSPKKYLMVDQWPNLLLGNDDIDLFLPRFVFEKDSSSPQKWYVPKSVEYEYNDNWVQARIDTIATYNNENLNSQIVNRFYNEEEDYFSFLFNLDTRAISPANRGATFYLVVAAATQDSTIGESSQKDLDNISSFFRTIALQAGIPFVEKLISGRNFTKSNILQAVNSLNPKSKDIVVFYYSGHGFRFDNDTSLYPRMSIRQNENQQVTDINIPLIDIYTILARKNAGCNMVIADCCNENIGAPFAKGRDLLRTKFVGFSRPQLNTGNFEQLFFPASKTNLIVASADKYQLASGNPGMGGYFTYHFKANLYNNFYTYSQGKTWLGILADTREKTRKEALRAICDKTTKSRCIQTPRFN